MIKRPVSDKEPINQATKVPKKTTRLTTEKADSKPLMFVDDFIKAACTSNQFPGARTKEGFIDIPLSDVITYLIAQHRMTQARAQEEIKSAALPCGEIQGSLFVKLTLPEHNTPKSVGETRS